MLQDKTSRETTARHRILKSKQELYLLRLWENLACQAKSSVASIGVQVSSQVSSPAASQCGMEAVLLRTGRLFSVWLKTAPSISGLAFPRLLDIYTSVIRRAHIIIKDSTHPQHSLFTLLPSGRCYRSVKSQTARLTNSLYPQARRLLNSALNPTPAIPYWLYPIMNDTETLYLT